jgi:hypothetical protein
MTKDREGIPSEGDCLEEGREIALDDTWTEEKDFDKGIQKLKTSDQGDLVETEYTTL